MYLFINDIIMLLCPSHVIHVTAEEMYCAGLKKVGREYITHVIVEQRLLCKWQTASTFAPYEADLCKIRSVFIQFVCILKHV
jgi:hypothetical protein